MAEAGAALRTETFYYSHRKGGVNGWHYLPVDVEAFVRSHLPHANTSDYEFLSSHNYDVGAATRKAYSLTDKVKITAIPKGSWFYNREPAFSVTGPSAIVSWLEPTMLRLHFRIQIATLFKAGKVQILAEKLRNATCQEELDIALEVISSLSVEMGSAIRTVPQFKTSIESIKYQDAVRERVQRLVKLVENPDRLFEVGMRGTSCTTQHELALMAVKEAGVMRTSNVALAKKLQMIPIGTMGHEHPQRFSFNDYEAFTAMRDRYPGFLFYLPDTSDTVRSGVPNALACMAETPERDAGIRFDSETHVRSHYMFTVTVAREMGLNPRLALESGWNYELTEEFEKLRKMVNWDADRQAYGYGGHFTNTPWDSFARDDVAAVWKLCQTGSCATMKFGDEPNSGKQSIPGRPVIWRPKPSLIGSNTPVSYIAQDGEDWTPPIECTLLSHSDNSSTLDPIHLGGKPPVMSPETRHLIRDCLVKRDEAIALTSLRGKH